MKKLCLFMAIILTFCFSNSVYAACAEELATIAPDLTSGQNNISAEDREILINVYQEALKVCDSGNEAAASEAISSIKSKLAASGN